MGKKEQYERNLPLLLNDKKINVENRKLFKKIFAELEYKLKRKAGKKELTEGNYKTLCGYIPYLKNVNLWFQNKVWKKLTEKQIKDVYDDLEDEKLKGTKGNIITAKDDYYNKIFKSLPFELAKKDKVTRKVMKYVSSKEEEVRFFDKETFQKICNGCKTLKHKLLCWLCWDFGENIFTILQIQKNNLKRRVNSDTKEVEYVLNFPKDKIKKSRTSRSEINNFEETAELLDSVLKGLKEDDFIFNFGHRQASKFLKQIVKPNQLKCINGEEITWKDFRSSMACHLLDLGWTTDEIKSRLGHKPSSRVLDKYVTYKAIGKHKPKQKTKSGEVSQLKEELEKIKQREKLILLREEEMNEKLFSTTKNSTKVILAMYRMINKLAKKPIGENVKLKDLDEFEKIEELIK